MTKLIAFLNDESGASAAEYAIILAIVGAAVAGAIAVFAPALGTAISGSSTLFS